MLFLLGDHSLYFCPDNFQPGFDRLVSGANLPARFPVTAIGVHVVGDQQTKLPMPKLAQNLVQLLTVTPILFNVRIPYVAPAWWHPKMFKRTT